MTKNEIIFNGLGFPLVLVNAPTKVVFGETVPDIDFDRLERIVFLDLIFKRSRISGAELRFIRHRMGLSQADFAKELNVDRTAVSKWESKDLTSTGMEPNTEAYLRSKMVRFVSKSRLMLEIVKSIGSRMHESLNRTDLFLTKIEPGICSKGVGKPIKVKEISLYH